MDLRKNKRYKADAIQNVNTSPERTQDHRDGCNPSNYNVFLTKTYSPKTEYQYHTHSGEAADLVDLHHSF